jgi:hypothetical protein
MTSVISGIGNNHPKNNITGIFNTVCGIFEKFIARFPAVTKMNTKNELYMWQNRFYHWQSLMKS